MAATRSKAAGDDYGPLLSKYQFILNSTNDLISLVDRQYRYLFVNQPYLNIYDRPLDQIIGHSIGEVWGEKKFTVVLKENFDQAFAGYDVRDQAWIGCGRHGERFMDISYRPYRGGPGVEAVLVVSHDITDLKSTQEELQLSRTNYRSLVESSIDCILELEPGGTITFLNPAAQKLFKARSNLMLHVHPEDLEATRAAWEALQAGQALQHFDNRVRDAAGKIHYLSWNARPIRDGRGELVAVTAIARDVSHRRQVDTIISDTALTRRESEVFRLVLGGYTNLNIASRLGIQESTVKFHLNSVFEKTRTQSRAELITLAHQGEGDGS